MISLRWSMMYEKGDSSPRAPLGSRRPKAHLPCCDQTNPKCSDKDASLEAWSYLKKRLKELGLSEAGGVARTKANCLRICEGGPIAVVYPEGAWYGGVIPTFSSR